MKITVPELAGKWKPHQMYYVWFRGARNVGEWISAPTMKRAKEIYASGSGAVNKTGKTDKMMAYITASRTKPA